MEQKQYINNCIFKITEKEENWIDEDPQKTEEQENWIDDNPQTTEQQNVKVRKILEDVKPEKGNIFFKIL